jgi:uncharacterized protein DUF6884
VIRVVLACGAQKLPTAAPALELYTGPLFASARRWALSVTSRDRIFILSALHGLVGADQVLEPYDQRIRPSRNTVDRVADQADELGLFAGPVYFAGGEVYRLTLILAGLEVRAVSHALPPGRTTRGIGAQRAWFGRNLGQLPGPVQL